MQRERLLNWSGMLIAVLMVPLWVYQVGLTIVQTRELGGVAALSAANDWSHYYASARRLIEGRRVYCEPFVGEAEKGVSGNPISQSTNPPLLVLLTAPFALFQRPLAWALWNFAALVGAGAAVSMLGRLFGFSGIRTAFVAVLVLLSNPMISNLVFSQVQALLFTLVVLYIWLYSRNYHRAAGAVLGVASAIKFMSLPLVLFANGARNWKTAAAALLTFSAALLGTQLFAELAFFDYLRCGARTVEQWGLGSSCNLSLPFLIRNVLAVIAGSVSDVAWSTRLLSAMFFLLSALLIVYTGIRAASSARSKRPSEPLAFSVLFWCMGLPLMWPHYYLFLWIPVIALIGRTRLLPWQAGFFCAFWLSLPLYPVFLDAQWQSLSLVSRLENSVLVFLPSLVSWLCLLVLIISTRADSEQAKAAV